MIPISFLIVLLITTKLLNKNISYLSDLLYISIGIYFFWSVQGWYPEFRFINYSVGYLILLSLIMTIEKLDGKVVIGYSSIIIFYFSIDLFTTLPGLEKRYKYNFNFYVFFISFELSLYKRDNKFLISNKKLNFFTINKKAI